MTRAILALSDGTVFEGRSFGAPGEATGEVVFNTSMTGYQEVLTDPSYCGQIVAMTSPHIGNCGINPEDMESSRSQVAGFVVREAGGLASNYRSCGDLAAFLKCANVCAVEGIDTRELTRKLRLHGTVQGILSTMEADPKTLVARAKKAVPIGEQDLVGRVTTDRAAPWKDAHPSVLFHPPQEKEKEDRRRSRRFKVAALDYGIKHNILRCLESLGCDVTVRPAKTQADEILASRPDGVFLSNGPGDPQRADYAVQCAKGLLGKVPVFGICLGHQVLALALGARTYKLKFGHRGANHPVKNLRTGKVEITTQNHGYAVDPGALADREVEVTHLNLNDGTVEGFRHRTLPLFAVQYHPEASAGPHDSAYLFSEFAEMMAERAPVS